MHSAIGFQMSIFHFNWKREILSSEAQSESHCLKLKFGSDRSEQAEIGPEVTIDSTWSTESWRSYVTITLQIIINEKEAKKLF